MSNLCIITARGGSKRIPRKNIKDFLGKPIIAYSIITALESGLFEEVMVSTDDEEIAEISRRYGAAVPFMRSEETSNDHATTREVLQEVLDRYAERGKTFDYFSCIYPTAPFITSQRLVQAFHMLEESDADEIVSVTRFSYPPQRAYVVSEGYLVYQYPQYANARSQDLESVYHDCGQFYFYRTDSFRGSGIEKVIPLEIPEEEVQDIDNLSDWKLAELKYTMLHMEIS